MRALWNMKLIVMPIIIWALGMIHNNLGKRIELEIRRPVGAIQMTVLCPVETSIL